jgi:hypothetical protein
MKHRALVQSVAVIVIAVFAIGIWSSGGRVELGWLKFFSVAVFIAMLLLWLWDIFLWRLPLAQKIGRVPRDVRGTWCGTLTSAWADPKESKPPAPKLAYLVVRQTASTISVILLTDESRSVSSLGVVSSEAGTASLDYIYRSRPDSHLEHRSRMHHARHHRSTTNATTWSLLDGPRQQGRARLHGAYEEGRRGLR